MLRSGFKPNSQWRRLEPSAIRAVRHSVSSQWRHLRPLGHQGRPLLVIGNLDYGISIVVNFSPILQLSLDEPAVTGSVDRQLAVSSYALDPSAIRAGPCGESHQAFSCGTLGGSATGARPLADQPPGPDPWRISHRGQTLGGSATGARPLAD